MKTLFNLVAGGHGRIVSTNDLCEFQIAEARRNGTLFVDEDGFGFVCLAWHLTTSKDKQRERSAA